MGASDLNSNIAFLRNEFSNIFEELLTLALFTNFDTYIRSHEELKIKF